MAIVHHQVNIQSVVIIDISKAGNGACQLNDAGSNKNIALAHFFLEGSSSKSRAYLMTALHSRLTMHSATVLTNCGSCTLPN